LTLCTAASGKADLLHLLHRERLRLADGRHKDNHAGLMTPAQMETFQKAMPCGPGHEWDAFEGCRCRRRETAGLSRPRPLCGGQGTPSERAVIDVPDALAIAVQPVMATQTGFGALLNEIGRGDGTFAQRIVTTSPDVTVSTNLGPWVNRRGLFAREKLADTFKSERIPSTFNWEFSPKGQHIELGIAEMNLFVLSRRSACPIRSMASGCCRSARCTILSSRAASIALNYACYQERVSSWWRRRPASRSRAKAAPINPSPSH